MSSSRALRRALTALAALVVLGLVAVTVLAWSTPRSSAASSQTAATRAEPVTGQVALLHAVPVTQPDGIVQTDFAGGYGLDDVDQTRQAMVQLADEAGLGDVVYDVFYELDSMVNDLTTADDNPPGAYPWSFPGLESVLDPVLTPDVLDAHRDALNELASLAILAAANDDGIGVDEYESNTWAGAFAYALLSALAQDPHDCTAHLDLATLVSLGDYPTETSLDQVFSQAVAACPDDPTAHWLWVQSARDLRAGLRGGREQLDAPLELARDWERSDPGSALPWASEGEALVYQAELLSDRGVAPFTVRSRARLALERFRQAEAVEHSPWFLAGEARALSALGENDGAADTLAPAVQERPDDLDLHLLQVDLLERAHRWSDAAAAGQARRLFDYAQPDPLSLQHDGAPSSAGLVGLGRAGAVEAIVRDPTFVEEGAGAVEWLGYVPDYRGDFRHPSARFRPSCSTASVVRDLVLAGEPEQALAAADVMPVDGNDCSFGRSTSDYDYPNDSAARTVTAIAAEQAGDDDRFDEAVYGDEYDDQALSLDAVFDDEQNLYRFAGDLDEARSVAESWVDQLDSPLAHDRLAEVLFLQGDHRAAAAEFGTAAGVPPDDSGTWLDGDVAVARLAEATALERAGDTGAAERGYDELAGEISSDSPTVALSAAAAQARIGLLALDGDRPDDAVPHLRAAAAEISSEEHPDSFDVLDDSLTGGAEANNLAVALLAQDDVSSKDAQEALDAATFAVRHDYDSPVYGDTLALAEHAGGHDEAAVDAYRAAVAADPTLYQSWNNLGVLLDQAGEREDAVTAFRHAVAVRHDYALGWFNLGVELGRGWSPRSFVESQRAMARATRLDSSFRGQGAAVQQDSSPVVTGLDVSRPVAADWQFASAASRTAGGLSLVVLLLALWRLGLALGLDQVGGWVAERALSRRTHQRWTQVWSRVDRFTGVVPALLLALVVCAWPITRGGAGQHWQFAATILGLGACLWLYVAVGRWRAARVGGPHRPLYQGWAPGMAFGAVTALVGYAFVPVPVNAEPHTDRRVRLAGHRLLAVLAAVLLVVGFLTGAPVARLVGVGALAMLSTALAPIRPYDGGFLHHRLSSTVTAVVMVVVSGALVLGLV